MLMMMAISAIPTPQMMPTAMDQNRNIKSIGSLMAVRNRTIDNAPTMPRDTTMLDWIVRMIAEVIRAIPAREMLKFLE